MYTLSLKKYLFLILWIVAVPVLSAANVENPSVIKVFSYIYNQQFDKADSVLHTHKAEISHFFETILTLDLNYWKCTSLDTKDEYKQFEKLLDASLPENTNSEMNKVKSMVVYIYSLRYYYKQFNLIRFNITLMKMKVLEEKIDEKTLAVFEEGAEIMKIYHSMYKYFVGKLNPFLLIIRKDNNAAEIKLLKKKCQDDGLIISTLAHYFVGKIYLQFEKDPLQAEPHFETLIQRFPGNNKFRELAWECRQSN